MEAQQEISIKLILTEEEALNLRLIMDKVIMNNFAVGFVPEKINLSTDELDLIESVQEIIQLPHEFTPETQPAESLGEQLLEVEDGE